MKGGDTVFKKTVIIVVVSALLGLGGFLWNNGTYSDGSIVIGDGTEKVIPFVCENMLPGDSTTEKYLVTVVDEHVTAVRFKVHTNGKYGDLSEALRITVRADGKTLYDGTMAAMDKYVRVVVPEDNTIEYALTVYLGTEVGNEYAAKRTTVDFEWAAMDGDYVGPVYPGTDYPEYPEPTPPEEPDDPVVPPDEPDDPEDPDDPDDPVIPDDPEDPGDEPDEPDQPEQPTPPADEKDEKCCPWCFKLCPWCYIIPIIVIAVAGALTVNFIRKKLKKKK